ncbi:hypothetical protein DMENIID0001_019520 [Sergentomyia squamirostris]
MKAFVCFLVLFVVVTIGLGEDADKIVSPDIIRPQLCAPCAFYMRCSNFYDPVCCYTTIGNYREFTNACQAAMYACESCNECARIVEGPCSPPISIDPIEPIWSPDIIEDPVKSVE